MAIIFYDLETFGTDPASDRIAEFAGILTDDSLDLLEQPYELRCLPPPDYLASPGACLTTGITPQAALQTGLLEPDFARKIHRWFTAHEKTLILGYNNAKFDDEFIRYLFYRTFLDPYGWHYRNGNRRMDLFSIMPALFDYYPDILRWPRTDTDLPDFRLEALAAANDALGGTSHEALSDTFALRNLAKRIADEVPDVWHAVPSLLDRKTISQRVRRAYAAGPIVNHGTHGGFDLSDRESFASATLAYSSAMIKTTQRASTFLLPLGIEPSGGGAETWWFLDLDRDPRPLLALPPENVARHFFTRDRDEAFRSLHRINPRRFPFLIPTGSRQIEALGLKGLPFEAAVQTGNAAISGGIGEWIQQFFAALSDDKQDDKKDDTVAADSSERDVDRRLYDGFLDDRDRNVTAKLEDTSTIDVANAVQSVSFIDERYRLLARRFIARYAPQRLSTDARLQFRREAMRRLDIARFDTAWRAARADIDNGVPVSGLPRSKQNMVMEQLREHRNSVVSRMDATDRWGVLETAETE